MVYDQIFAFENMMTALKSLEKPDSLNYHLNFNKLGN